MHGASRASSRGHSETPSANRRDYGRRFGDESRHDLWVDLHNAESDGAKDLHHDTDR